MQDYAKLYRRKSREKLVIEEKLRRVRKALTSGLPAPMIMLIILLIVKK